MDSLEWMAQRYHLELLPVTMDEIASKVDSLKSYVMVDSVVFQWIIATKPTSSAINASEHVLVSTISVIVQYKSINKQYYKSVL